MVFPELRQSRAAAGFEGTLLRWNLKLEVGCGNETADPVDGMP
jgi:hypothetical protein